MQVSSKNNISFGKISWGTPEQEKKTQMALERVKKCNLDYYHHVEFNDVIEQLELISKHKDEVIITADVSTDNSELFTLKSRDPANNRSICTFNLGLKFPVRPATNSVDLKDFAKRTISTISLLNQGENGIKDLMDKLSGKKN